MRTCPLCKSEYTEHPALSRFDNETEICPDCGTIEAMTAWLDPTFKGFDPKETPKGTHGLIIGRRMDAYHDVTIYEDGHEEKDYIGD